MSYTDSPKKETTGLKRDITFRLRTMFGGIIIIMLAVLAKLLSIQWKEGGSLRNRGSDTNLSTLVFHARRGNIYSEKGALLSTTVVRYEAHVDFSVIDSALFSEKIDSLSYLISALLNNKTSAAYKEDFMTAYKNKDKYYLIARNITIAQVESMRQFPVFDKGRFKGGLITDYNEKRMRFQGSLAADVIGSFVDSSINGLEKSYNDYLTGQDGSAVAQRSVGNKLIPIEGTEKKRQNGKDVICTIDLRIQNNAKNVLYNVLNRYNATFGTCIVMEVKTGKIRALVNLGRQSDGNYTEDFNYAMMPAEPGGVFGLISLYALLEDGYITVDDNVNVQGGIAVFGNQRVVDDHSGLGIVSIKKAFAQASNVAFAKLVNQYYHNDPMKYIRHLQQLQLDKKTGIDLVGERLPTIKTPQDKSWNTTTSLPWIGFGYESLVSPMQLCMVYNAIANNGKMMKPYLVSKIQEYGREVKKFEPTTVVAQMGKISTIKQLQGCLKTVVEEGTGRGIRHPNYTIAGKTGSVQVADKGISYMDGVRQGSFIGYFPYENPQYTIAVVVRSSPHGAYYGAQVAAPVFREISDAIIKHGIYN